MTEPNKRPPDGDKPRPTVPHPRAIVALLGHEDRLKVLSAIALGCETIDEITRAASLSGAKTLKAVSRLTGAGIVSLLDGRYRVVASTFKDALKATEDGDWGISHPSPDVEKELRKFFAEGRLSAIPMRRKQRLAVLDFLALQFEPGRDYTEGHVNVILRNFFHDYATLRRFLVDEGFLERKQGRYWRAGGTFDVD